MMWHNNDRMQKASLENKKNGDKSFVVSVIIHTPWFPVDTVEHPTVEDALRVVESRLQSLVLPFIKALLMKSSRIIFASQI